MILVIIIEDFYSATSRETHKRGARYQKLSQWPPGLPPGIHHKCQDDTALIAAFTIRPTCENGETKSPQNRFNRPLLAYRQFWTNWSFSTQTNIVQFRLELMQISISIIKSAQRYFILKKNAAILTKDKSLNLNCFSLSQKGLLLA